MKLSTLLGDFSKFREKMMLLRDVQVSKLSIYENWKVAWKIALFRHQMTVDALEIYFRSESSDHNMLLTPVRGRTCWVQSPITLCIIYG